MEANNMNKNARSLVSRTCSGLLVPMVLLITSGCAPFEPQLICSELDASDRHLKIHIKDEKVKKVTPKKKHVCQGDTVIWKSNDKDFKIAFPKGSPMAGACQDSAGQKLSCTVKSDAEVEKKYKYSITSGKSTLDPHIIVD